jgi:enoyl-[acyl-carrier protein] reductase/trans-2-enoyl-CoA reductase (NAD+)
MLISPTIRNNFFTNAHPEGCYKNLESQIQHVKSLGTYVGPKNVLIIGGSSGYGLGSRISLAFGANANTVNVSYESAPRGKRTGSAGYWNNAFFQHFAKETNNIHKDFMGDAFSPEMKQDVLEYVKSELGSIDLIIYSLAAGARKNFETGETVRSHIKTLGDPVVGKTIDIAKMSIEELTVEPATEQETKDTVFVMGGSDWYDWVTLFKQENVLAEKCKTIAYTYIGGPTTAGIYRKGTMGQAKLDLELKAQLLNDLLKKDLNGEAMVSSSKAVVSKASVFIPQMPIYVACLFDVMKKNHVHESILEHKHRLFKDMVYGSKRILDDKKRIRLDHLEMDETIQEETLALMDSLDNDGIMSLPGTQTFLQEFHQINGFDIDSIDYSKEIDIDSYKENYPIK